MWDLCSFGKQWLLPWNSSMDAIFTQYLSYCWIMITELYWGKWSLQFFKCCSFISSWMSRCYALGVILVGWPFPGSLTKFNPFVDKGLHHHAAFCSPLMWRMLIWVTIVCQLSPAWSLSSTVTSLICMVFQAADQMLFFSILCKLQRLWKIHCEKPYHEELTSF